METDSMDIGLSGLPIGPFPKPEEIGALLSHWVLLPQAKGLGFSEEELIGYFVDWLSMFSGLTLGEWAHEVHNGLMQQFKNAALMMAEKLPAISYTVITSPKGKPMTHEFTAEEKAASVVALFSALYTYFCCVKRMGLDKANAESFKVFEELDRLPPEYLLNLAGILSELQQGTATEFTNRLRKDQVEGMVIFPKPKGMTFSAFVEKLKKSLKDPSATPPKPDAYIVGKWTRDVGESSKPDLHDAGYYLESLAASLLIGREDFIVKGVNLSVAQDEGLAIMDGKYTELGGEQGIAESLAQDYLNKRSQGISKASFLNGEAFRRAKEALNTLEPMMTKFKKESTEELEESERLRRLGQPPSLDKEIEGEDGEIATLADMMPAPADLEEAMPQLLEIFEKELQPEDVELLKERFIDGKTITEIAIERDWEYDRAQRHILRLVNEILEKMS